MTGGKMPLRQVIAFGLAACFLYGVGGGLRADIGGYEAVWSVDILLCLFAAFMSSRIQ